jgi:transposase-like protein
MPMTANDRNPGIDERTIELIADRVAALLREELEAIATDLSHAAHAERPLTVDDVAERFGVARSTVYAHWREWGGYKLGGGEKASIRFRPTTLPEHPTAVGKDEQREATRGGRRRRKRAVLPGQPRLYSELD